MLICGWSWHARRNWLKDIMKKLNTGRVCCRSISSNINRSSHKCHRAGRQVLLVRWEVCRWAAWAAWICLHKFRKDPWVDRWVECLTQCRYEMEWSDNFFFFLFGITKYNKCKQMDSPISYVWVTCHTTGRLSSSTYFFCTCSVILFGFFLSFINA